MWWPRMVVATYLGVAPNDPHLTHHVVCEVLAYLRLEAEDRRTGGTAP